MERHDQIYPITQPFNIAQIDHHWNKATKAEGHMTLVLRHAHRENIPPGTFGSNLPLSEVGKKTAHLLGEKLAHLSLKVIYTSPLIRCIQTAQEFQKGFQENLPIEPSNLLGDPGLFIEDPSQAGPLILKYPIEHILKEIVKKKSFPGIRTLEEGGYLFLEWIARIKSPSLIITHDWIVCLLRCFFSNSDEIMMPQFLEGFLVRTFSHRAQ